MTIRAKYVKDVEDIAGRVLEIRHSRGTFHTPVRVLRGSSREDKIITSKDCRGVVEVYARLTPNKLKRMWLNLSEEYLFTCKIRRAARKAQDYELVIAIPEIEAKPSSRLRNSVKVGECILELFGAVEVDVLCTPIFNRVNERYVLPILQGFLEAASTIDKPIALLIPEVSRDLRDRIVKMYFELADRNNNLLTNVICVDYDGSNPVTRYSKHIFALKLSKELEWSLDEPVVIYGVNVKFSKASHKSDEITARDLVSPFIGIDIIGPNHRRPVISGDVADLLKQRDVEKKILSTTNYSYLTIEKALILRNSLPELRSGVITIDSIMAMKLSGKSRFEEEIRLYNAEKSALEIARIRKMFSEGDVNPKSYLLRKPRIKTDKIVCKRFEKCVRLISRYRKMISRYKMKKLTDKILF